MLAGGYDALQNLNYRILPGGGLGFHAIATSRTLLDLLGGLGHTRESYTTGVTRNLFTATLGDEFEYKLTRNTIITQNLYYLPELTNSQYAIYHVANYRVNGNIGIATKLNGWMTANMNFNDRYNSQPVLGVLLPNQASRSIERSCFDSGFIWKPRLGGLDHQVVAERHIYCLLGGIRKPFSSADAHYPGFYSSVLYLKNSD